MMGVEMLELGTIVGEGAGEEIFLTETWE